MADFTSGLQRAETAVPLCILPCKIGSSRNLGKERYLSKTSFLTSNCKILAQQCFKVLPHPSQKKSKNWLAVLFEELQTQGQCRLQRIFPFSTKLRSITRTPPKWLKFITVEDGFYQQTIHYDSNFMMILMIKMGLIDMVVF